jgi:hypothetical protein
MQAHEIVPSEHMKDVIDKALRHHQFISFCLYIAGALRFIALRAVHVARMCMESKKRSAAARRAHGKFLCRQP